MTPCAVGRIGPDGARVLIRIPKGGDADPQGHPAGPQPTEDDHA